MTNVAQQSAHLTNNPSSKPPLGAPYWYVPNIICYLRAMLILIPLATAMHYPLITLAACIISMGLDTVDGVIARWLNQESQLGQLLDYAIDRSSVAICCVILAVLIPSYWWLFALTLLLDLSSHFAHLYGTVFSKEKHHKTTSKQQNSFIQAYYGKRIVMFFACASHDFLLAAIYVDHFFHAFWSVILILLFIPGFLFKTMIHVLQIRESMHASLQTENSST